MRLNRSLSAGFLVVALAACQSAIAPSEPQVASNHTEPMGERASPEVAPPSAEAPPSSGGSNEEPEVGPDGRPHSNDPANGSAARLVMVQLRASDEAQASEIARALATHGFTVDPGFTPVAAQASSFTVRGQLRGPVDALERDPRVATVSADVAIEPFGPPSE